MDQAGRHERESECASKARVSKRTKEKQNTREEKELEKFPKEQNRTCMSPIYSPLPCTAPNPCSIAYGGKPTDMLALHRRFDHHFHQTPP